MVWGHYFSFPRAQGGKWLVPAAELLSAEGNAGPAAPLSPGADLFLYLVLAVSAGLDPHPLSQQGLPLLTP